MTIFESVRWAPIATSSNQKPLRACYFTSSKIWQKINYFEHTKKTRSALFAFVFASYKTRAIELVIGIIEQISVAELNLH